jgi:predicted site-specific integrase-resolvase
METNKKVKSKCITYTQTSSNDNVESVGGHKPADQPNRRPIISQRNCFVYARCSSQNKKTQNEHLQLQIDEAEKLARRRKFEVKNIFTENKHAAKTNSRPAFEDMLKRIKSGEADSIICYRLDRLFRNENDSIKLCQAFKQGFLKPIITTEGEFTPLLDTFPPNRPKNQL